MNQEIEGKLQDIFQRFGFIRTPEQEAGAIKAIQELVVSTVPDAKPVEGFNRPTAGRAFNRCRTEILKKWS